MRMFWISVYLNCQPGDSWAIVDGYVRSRSFRLTSFRVWQNWITDSSRYLERSTSKLLWNSPKFMNIYHVSPCRTTGFFLELPRSVANFRKWPLALCGNYTYIPAHLLFALRFVLRLNLISYLWGCFGCCRSLIFWWLKTAIYGLLRKTGIRVCGLISFHTFI